MPAKRVSRVHTSSQLFPWWICHGGVSAWGGVEMAQRWIMSFGRPWSSSSSKQASGSALRGFIVMQKHKHPENTKNDDGWENVKCVRFVGFFVLSRTVLAAMQSVRVLIRHPMRSIHKHSCDATGCYSEQRRFWSLNGFFTRFCNIPVIAKSWLVWPVDGLPTLTT